jgi:TonB-dependent receptor
MKKSKLSLALLAALYIQAPAYAFAEEAEVEVETKLTAKEQAAKNKAAQKESDIEVITIGGMRSSEVAAINMKKFASTISDNLSAEDVGALPSQSIAESLERLAGVTGNQDQGRSNTISVRGMGGAYTLTTLNEREIVSSFGSRSINLSLFPSAAVRRAQVYKTARADGLEGGISGHVNMETFKPLEVDRNVATFSASVNSGEQLQDLTDGDKYGKNVDGLFSYHINDDFAISVGGSWRENTEYFDRLKNAEIMGQVWAPDYNNDGIDDFGNPATTLTSNQRNTQQDSIFAAAQYAPTDNLVISFDYLSSNYNYQAFNNVWSSWGVGTPDKLLGDPALADLNAGNFLMSGTAALQGVGKWDSSVLNEDATKAYGFNVDYLISDDLSLNFDVSHSSAERFYSWRSAGGRYGNEDDHPGINHYYNFDHYGDYGFEYLGTDFDGSAYDPVTYELDESQLVNAANDPDLWVFTGLSNGHNFMDSAVSAVKVDLTYDVDIAMVHQLKFGGRYSENIKEAVEDKEEYLDYNTRAPATGEESNGRTTFTDAEWGEVWGQISDVDWVAANTSLSDSPFSTMDKVKGFENNFFVDAADIINAKSQYFPDRVISEQDKFASYDIKESTIALYAQASFAGQWYDGIIGIRYYETELESTSWQSDFEVVQKFEIDEDTGEEVPVDGQYLLRPGDNPGYVTSTNEYSDFLPTLNVNLRLIEDFVIRIGLGKAMIRPSLGEINSGIQLKSPNSPDQDFPEGEDGKSSSKTLGTAGNPYLLPITSKQADISFEYYPTQWDMFAFAVFHKDLDGIYETGATYIPIQGSEDKHGDEIRLPMTAEQKAEGGSVSGWEFSFRQHLGGLTPYLQGFALSGNYMDFFHDAKQDYNRSNPGQAPMWRSTELYYQPAGWIDSTYNVALTYDNGGDFNARLNLNQQEGAAQRDGNDGKAKLQHPTKNLSFSVRYKATSQISVFAQASNLTNEVVTSGNLSSDKLGVAHSDVIYEQSASGITWYAGVRVNF